MLGLCRKLPFVVIIAGCLACTSKDQKNGSQKEITAAELPVGQVEKGLLQYNTCKACHGESGQGNEKLKAPALANTDSWYLYRQLVNFKDPLSVQM